MPRHHFSPADWAGGVHEVLNLGGLVLRAECTGADNLHVQADTTVGDAIITSSMVRDQSPADVAHAVHDPDFNPGDNLDILDERRRRHIVVRRGRHAHATRRPPGVTVTATFQADEVPFGTGDGCLFAGHALRSG